ncbi:hypothetical protein LJC25_05695, partial [Bacteroidales bacterium OttesenSCG-928-K03]|nr:hypothetical protein [Bacteroidales bacterium OttesenSCG-928-K03]
MSIATNTFVLFLLVVTNNFILFLLITTNTFGLLFFNHHTDHHITTSPNHLRVLNDKICTVTPIAIANNNILNHHISTKNIAEILMVIHKRETEVIFTLNGIA